MRQLKYLASTGCLVIALASGQAKAAAEDVVWSNPVGAVVVGGTTVTFGGSLGSAAGAASLTAGQIYNLTVTGTINANPSQPFSVGFLGLSGNSLPLFTASYINGSTSLSAGNGFNLASGSTFDFGSTFTISGTFAAPATLGSPFFTASGMNVSFTGTVAAVPGPIAGAGLPALALLGAFAWFRRRSNKGLGQLAAA